MSGITQLNNILDDLVGKNNGKNLQKELFLLICELKLEYMDD